MFEGNEVLYREGFKYAKLGADELLVASRSVFSTFLRFLSEENEVLGGIVQAHNL